MEGHWRKQRDTGINKVIPRVLKALRLRGHQGIQVINVEKENYWRNRSPLGAYMVNQEIQGIQVFKVRTGDQENQGRKKIR